MSFWAELRRRNVFRVGAVYLASAWVVSQVGDVVAQAFDAPAWPMRMLLVLIALGLPIALLFSWLFELTPDGVKLTKDVSIEASTAPKTAQRLDRVLIGMIGLLIVVLIAVPWLTRARDASRPAAGGAEPAAVAPVPGAQSPTTPGARKRLANSVAVLPPANLSPDPGNAMFVAGVHEEIIGYLAKLKSLNVIARTSVARYANTDKSIQEIGAELNVRAVMEGAVRYADNRVRINMKLVDAETGASLWAEVYERDFKDVFAIQADIAMSVANALNAEFSSEEQRQIERAPTNSAEAHTLLIQYLDLTGRGDPASLLTLLDQVIARDPSFAEAYGYKAALYANMLINTVLGSAGDRAQAEALARDNARRALALDPASESASSALGFVDTVNWRWEQARATFEGFQTRTGHIAPIFDWFTAWQGRPLEAVAMSERNVDLDPLNWVTHWFLGMTLLYAGDSDRSVAALHRSIALAPTLSQQHSWLAWAEIARGNDAEALTELKTAETLLGRNRVIVSLVDILYGYGRIGRRDDVARIYAEIQGLAPAQDIGAGGWASVYLGIGDEAKALEQLRLGAERARDKVLDPGFYTLMNIRMNPTKDPVLSKPDFAAVRERLTGG
ncbi:MAG TPA: hypothetical protein VFX89_14870 [Gammaproteobacteria bacterium]|nr:hypothetical protein [Gammaproteobacteria bacterium]